MQQTNEQNIFLAFDFGTKNIGLAIGQKITHSATPLQPIHATQGIPNWIQVDQIIKKWLQLAMQSISNADGLSFREFPLKAGTGFKRE